MNKHGVSRRWCTKIDVKHFKSDVLRTITNVVEKKYTFYGKLKKRIPSQVYSKDLIHGYRITFSNINFFICLFHGFY